MHLNVTVATIITVIVTAMSDWEKNGLYTIARCVLVILSVILLYIMFYRKQSQEDDNSENFEDEELTWD